MADGKWQWTPEGVSFGDKKYALVKGLTQAAVGNYAERYILSRSAWNTLRKAELSFEGGMADYAGAYPRLVDLHRELVAGSIDGSMIAHDVGRFFEPNDLPQEFKDDPKGLGRFVAEAVEMLRKMVKG